MSKKWITLAGLLLIAGGVGIAHGMQKPNMQTPKSVSIIKHQKPTFSAQSFPNKDNLRDKSVRLTTSQENFVRPVKPESGRYFKMMTLDSLGRARGSRIQLNKSELPKVKRSPYLTIRPSGWHNYKYKYNGYTGWLFNRGHLVGYQFCGVNQAPGNMITQTAYVNQGSLTGMDDSNIRGQLYYENRLANWIKMHPNEKLDYVVMPVYKGSELVPRQVRFYFVGFKGRRQVRVTGINGFTRYHNKRGEVTLSNYSPNANINYATGRAVLK